MLLEKWEARTFCNHGLCAPFPTPHHLTPYCCLLFIELVFIPHFFQTVICLVYFCFSLLLQNMHPAWSCCYFLQPFPFLSTNSVSRLVGRAETLLSDSQSGARSDSTACRCANCCPVLRLSESARASYFGNFHSGSLFCRLFVLFFLSYDLVCLFIDIYFFEIDVCYFYSSNSWYILISFVRFIGSLIAGCRYIVNAYKSRLSQWDDKKGTHPQIQHHFLFFIHQSSFP